MIAYMLENTIEYQGKTLNLNLSFDNVLKFYDLQREDIFNDVEKLEITLEMFIKNYKKIKNMELQDKSNIQKIIFEKFIAIKSKPNSDNTKSFDFNQDANYIYSSFMLDYSMDLVEQQGLLDWRKFIALFQGLSEGTKIKQVMNIRTREVPEPTQYNAKEIQALMKAKAYYSLDISLEEAEEQFQKGINKLANTLIKRAVTK